MSYTIAILKNVYSPDTQGEGAVEFYSEEGNNPDVPEFFETVEAAKEKIEEIELETYVLQNVEAGSPDYYVVEENDADYILSGRNSDMSNYNWDDADCECGECSTCWEMMIDQDRQYIIDTSIE